VIAVITQFKETNSREHLEKGCESKKMSNTTENKGAALLSFGILLTMLITLSASYAATIAEISIEWSGNGVYSHGFLALLIAIYIAWQERKLLQNDRFMFRPTGLLLVLAAGLLWLASALVNVQLTQVFSFYLILIGALVSLYGWKITWVLRLPFLAILLVLPIWNFLQVPLQEISSDVTHVVLKLVGIPTLREGFKFSVPGGQFLVEEACAGLSFFLSSCLLGVLYVNFNNVVGIGRYYFLAFAIALALVSNWLRILIVIIVGNYTQMNSIIVQDHLTFGWILYAAMLIPFFVVGHYFTKSGSSEKTTSRDSQNTDISSTNSSTKTNPKVVYIGLILILLSSFPVTRLILDQQKVNSGQAKLIESSISGLADASIRGRQPVWEVNFKGSNRIAINQHAIRDQQFSTLVVDYTKQSQGNELINVSNTLYSKKVWGKIQEVLVTANSADLNTEYRLLKLKNRVGTIRQIAYWYQIGARITAVPRVAKFYELISRLSNDRSAHLIAIAIDTKFEKIPSLNTDALFSELSAKLQHTIASDSLTSSSFASSKTASWDVL
jgi:exosortase